MAGKTPQLLCPYTPENSSPLNFAPFLVPNIYDSELIDNLPSIASFLSLPATRLSSFSTPATLWRDVPGVRGHHLLMRSEKEKFELCSTQCGYIILA